MKYTYQIGWRSEGMLWWHKNIYSLHLIHGRKAFCLGHEEDEGLLHAFGERLCDYLNGGKE